MPGLQSFEWSPTILPRNVNQQIEVHCGNGALSSIGSLEAGNRSVGPEVRRSDVFEGSHGVQCDDIDINCETHSQTRRRKLMVV